MAASDVRGGGRSRRRHPAEDIVRLYNHRQVETAANTARRTGVRPVVGDDPRIKKPGHQDGGGTPAPTDPTTSPDGDTTDPADEKKPAVDYSSYFDYLGLPKDLIDEVNRMFADGGDDIQATIIRVVGYLRGTDWYKQTFPGIGEAIARGLVTDERGYRAMFNQVGQVYRQYAGRDLTTEEFAGHLREGVNVDTIARRFQGEAFIGANRADIQYYSGAFGQGRLTDDQLRQLGQHQAGLGTPGGLGLSRQFEEAIRRAESVFRGSLATLAKNPLFREAAQGGPDVGR